MLQYFILYIIYDYLLPEVFMNEKFLRVFLAIGHLKTYSISSCVCLSVMRMPAAFYLPAFRETGDWGFILKDSYHNQLLLGLVVSVTTKSAKTKKQRKHRIDFSKNWDLARELGLRTVHRFTLSFNFLIVYFSVEIWSVWADVRNIISFDNLWI